MLKKLHSKHAVSEVIGVILLLGITITLFVILNNYVFHFSFNPSSPTVNLIGTIDKTNDIISIKHNGGESFEGPLNILIQIGASTYQNTSNDLLVDRNADNKWNFGERLQFQSPEPIMNKYVRATVVDPETNTILLSVVLQQGAS
jgi:hypothetical protein